MNKSGVNILILTTLAAYLSNCKRKISLDFWLNLCNMHDQ